jgi:hypothetical protein
MMEGGGGDDSDGEIDEEVRRAAREADYAAGIAAEIGAEEPTGGREEIDRVELKNKRREESERLAAGQLPSGKKRLYDRLKEKEQSKKKREPEIPQTDELILDEKALDSDDDEEEEEEDEEQGENEDEVE